MARKLKTYITSIGFFEEAIAAPSMKAALEAWGSDRNLFHQGFAKETDDPTIIAETMKRPGIILKRAVGSKGIFSAQAELPKSFTDKQPAKVVAENKIKSAKIYSAEVNKKDVERDRKAAKAYKQKEIRRKQQRKKEQAIREKREAGKIKAELSLKKLQLAHNQRLQALQDQQAAIMEKIEAEETSWSTQKEQLNAAIHKLDE